MNSYAEKQVDKAELIDPYIKPCNALIIRD